jgi:hypothetical protein
MRSPVGEEEVAVVHCTQSRPKAIFSELLSANGTKLVDGGYIQGRHDTREVPSRRADVWDVVVDDCALDNRAVEQRPTLIRCRQQMAQNVRCARRFAEERDVLRIAAEFLDETMDPFHRGTLVTET